MKKEEKGQGIDNKITCRKKQHVVIDVL